MLLAACRWALSPLGIAALRPAREAIQGIVAVALVITRRGERLWSLYYYSRLLSALEVFLSDVHCPEYT